jgi:hypothetical protein
MAATKRTRIRRTPRLRTDRKIVILSALTFKKLQNKIQKLLDGVYAPRPDKACGYVEPLGGLAVKGSVAAQSFMVTIHHHDAKPKAKKATSPKKRDTATR